MHSCRVVSLAVLFLLTTHAGSQIKFNFSNDPRRIADVLKDEHTSGSLVFSGGCRFRDRTAPVPSVGLDRDPSSSAAQRLRGMLSSHSKLRVREDPDGLVRIFELGVSNDILDIKIHHISFGDGKDSLLHGTLAAKMTILAAPEVRAFEEEHTIQIDRRMEEAVPSGQGPDVSGELYDVTLSQAFDHVLKTFPGYWVYEDASCEDGTRQVRFRFY